MATKNIEDQELYIKNYSNQNVNVKYKGQILKYLKSFAVAEAASGRVRVACADFVLKLSSDHFYFLRTYSWIYYP